MWDMTKNKIKRYELFKKNTANNKTHTSQCLLPPGHVRN
jgi:hypothetical protein